MIRQLAHERVRLVTNRCERSVYRLAHEKHVRLRETCEPYH